jgi:hypothetical protein
MQLRRTKAFRNEFGGRIAKSNETTAGKRRRKKSMFIDTLVGSHSFGTAIKSSLKKTLNMVFGRTKSKTDL